MPEYMTSNVFGEFFGISERKARAALSRCYAGKTWRGCHLAVRLAPGRGGRGGVRYEVRADSIPGYSTPLEAAELPSIAPPALIDTEYDWKFRQTVIAPVLKTAPRSKERGNAIALAAAQDYVKQAGMVRVTDRTIRRWVTLYEQRGVAGLAKKTDRPDRGRRRVQVSREWDKFVASQIPAERQAEIVEALTTHVNSLWANPNAFSGWRMVADDASMELRELTAQALGVTVAKVPKAICALPRSFVERDRKAYQELGNYKRDRKKFEDTARPRITRSIENLQPMQIVMGDVHPQDIYYRRDDESTATAKLIAFLDVGTGRIRLQAEFLEMRKEVGEARVVRAFMTMAQDPRWGLPQSLYLDNGSEYQWDKFIADAMALGGMKIDLNGGVSASGKTGTIRARPYNAAAKGVLEGAFHQLESRFFSRIPGWIGGDRLKTKSANVGKAPVPYPGTKDDLIADIRNVETAFNDTAQLQGRLGGESPNEAFAAHVAAGWQRTDIDEASLYAAFCARESRTIRQGGIRHKGLKFYHDALVTLPAGSLVMIGIPKWGEESRLAVWDEHGGFLCVATVDHAFDHAECDAAGAIESARRMKVKRAAMTAHKAKTKPIDGRDRIAKRAAEAEPVPVPERGAVVTLDPNRTAAGKVLSIPAETARDIEDYRNSEFQSRQGDALRRLEIARAGG